MKSELGKFVKECKAYRRVHIKGKGFLNATGKFALYEKGVTFTPDKKFANYLQSGMFFRENYITLLFSKLKRIKIIDNKDIRFYGIPIRKERSIQTLDVRFVVSDPSVVEDIKKRCKNVQIDKYSLFELIGRYKIDLFLLAVAVTSFALYGLYPYLTIMGFAVSIYFVIKYGILRKKTFYDV